MKTTAYTWALMRADISGKKKQEVRSCINPGVPCDNVIFSTCSDFTDCWNGWKTHRARIGLHPHGPNDQADRRSPSGCTYFDSPEESGEPYHRGTEVLTPSPAFGCKPRVYRAFLHYSWGPLLEEERFELITVHNS